MAGKENTKTLNLLDYVPEKTIKIDVADQISSFLNKLDESPDLRVIHLSQVSIGKDVAVVLGNALAKLGNLEELHMAAAFKGRDIFEVVKCLEAISEGIATSGCQLKFIDISENAFRGTGIRGLSKVLTSFTCFKLEVLKMSDQGLSPEGGQVLGQMLEELLENAHQDNQQLVLHTFEASKNRLENPGATALGKFFGKITTMREVKMYQCGISADGISNLVRGLATNRELRFLDILDNTANEKAQSALADAIKKWGKLEDLRLSSCLIRDRGMIAILSSIQKHCPLMTTLDIGENSVEGPVEEEMLSHLTKMPNLQALVLAGNEFYDNKRVKALFEARFSEMGKDNVIKTSLGGGHVYDFDDGEEEDENDDEEDIQEVESDGEISEGSGIVEPHQGRGHRDSEQDNEPVGYIFDAEGDTMWTVTYPIFLEKGYPTDWDFDEQFFAQRMETNNCFRRLGILGTDLYHMCFIKPNLPEFVRRIAVCAFEFIDHRATEEEERVSIIYDNKLDALLVFCEYLVACAITTKGSALVEEFFKSVGVCGSGSSLTDDNLLRAQAWILRHLLYVSAIPLHIVGKVSSHVNSPSYATIVKKLSELEGFKALFAELNRQANLD